MLDIATSEIGKLKVIKGVYLQIQGEMMTCAGHKIIQGEGLKFRVWPADSVWVGNYAILGAITTGILFYCSDNEGHMQKAKSIIT